MRELSLFTGGGGGLLGSYLLGWHIMAAVEIGPYARNVLLQRQKDGILPIFPTWDDIRTFDGLPWAGWIDIITGGFPCQDISCAGKGFGIGGSRSGLWKEMARVVYEVQPCFVFVENVPTLTRRGLGVVLGDLAQMGYDARWCVLGADDAGAPHVRKRLWILAYPGGESRKKQKNSRWPARDRSGDGSENVSDTGGERREKRIIDKESKTKARGAGPNGNGIEWWNIDPADLPDTNQFDDDMGGYGAGEVRRQKQTTIQKCEISNTTNTGLQDWTEEEIVPETEELERLLHDRYHWPVESGMGRVVNGVASRVDMLKTIGNGQVPAVAALAFIILSEGLI